MEPVSTSLGILSSMITPAVLILASGSLITTTSQRLSRVIDRVRKVSQEFAQLGTGGEKGIELENKRRILYKLLKKSARRSKLLTRTMILLYVSLGCFVATSLALGVVAVTNSDFTWIPTAFGMIGAVVLFFSSAILIVESRVAFSAIEDELEFVIESSRNNAPEEKEIRRNKSWKKWFSV
jgi:hypothetical protein